MHLRILSLYLNHCHRLYRYMVGVGEVSSGLRDNIEVAASYKVVETCTNGGKPTAVFLS